MLHGELHFLPQRPRFFKLSAVLTNCLFNIGLAAYGDEPLSDTEQEATTAHPGIGSTSYKKSRKSVMGVDDDLNDRYDVRAFIAAG